MGQGSRGQGSRRQCLEMLDLRVPLSFGGGSCQGIPQNLDCELEVQKTAQKSTCKYVTFFPELE